MNTLALPTLGFPSFSAPEAGQFLSLRLSSSEASLVQGLHQRTGLSKSEIVKQALRAWAHSTEQQAGNVSLYDLGQKSFGKYADASRQSKDVKAVVRERLMAKQKTA